MKPDFGHLRIFGCMTYSYIPKEKRTKLEPTAEKGIFMGYSETSKAFQIYIPAQRKVVVRQDVKFEEDTAFRRSRELRVSGSARPSGAAKLVAGIQWAGIRRIRRYIYDDG